MRVVEDANRWQTKSLRDLATINYGRYPAEILSDDGPYPVVGTGGGERLGNDYLHEGDSIILGRKGTIDRVCFVTGRFWTIDTAYYLSGFGDTVPRWLFYYLQTLDLRQMNEATCVPSLSRDLLYKIEIPTPPKPEQTKIAEILSMVDRAIEQTEALIAKQQRIKTGLMQDLLTRGIDEHGNLRSEQTHKFKDSRLGRIPVEWEPTQIVKAASFIIWMFMDGKTYAEMAAIFLVIELEKVDAHRSQGQAAIPAVFSFIGRILHNLSIYAGALLVILEESNFLNGEIGQVPLLPLAIWNGCNGRDSLAWFRYGYRNRIAAHEFAQLYPIPPEIQSDNDVRAWVTIRRRAWLDSDPFEIESIPLRNVWIIVNS